MADSYHHAVSSSRKWGGRPEDYLPVHDWFDSTKRHFSDPRHRALRHHSQGIGWAIDYFGPVVTISACARCGGREIDEVHDTSRPGAVHAFVPKSIPTRWIGEQHVLEDFGFIPTMADFLRHMTTEMWMVRGAKKLSIELAREEAAEEALR